MSLIEGTSTTSVTPVRYEHRDDALGIGTATPRLSWQVRTDDPHWRQVGYELDWNGTVVREQSAEQVLVPWPFSPLKSRQRAEIRVRVASADGWSSWSDTSSVEAGLLSEEDWHAHLISPRTIGSYEDAAPILARNVVLRSDVVSARWYLSACGTYEATLNDQPIGDEVLAPGWTAYQHRLRYQTYDVTEKLRRGENELRVLLGNGWYRGRIRRNADYGDRLGLLGQLEITYADRSVDVIGTDRSWYAYRSSILSNDIYDGQVTDLRLAAAGRDDVEVLPIDRRLLISGEGPPMRVTELVPVRKKWESPSGKTLVDFGQNLVGWVRLRVQGPGKIVVRHAEVLENGELATRPLRTAKATDEYLLPEGEHLLESRLTFHGFRYAEIAGTAAFEAEAVVIGTGLRREGWFSCSDAELERFHENVVWGTRGNFLDVPVDCPQRDERMGWTGDLQVFAPTACFLFDCAGFLSSWLADLAAEQHLDGAVPYVIPDVRCDDEPVTAGWGDASVLVPWTVYQRYGDKAILRRQFASMRAWVDKVLSIVKNGTWSAGFQWGDWLDPIAPPDDPWAAKADADVLATAYLARSLQLVAETAEVLGYSAEAMKYGAVREAVRAAFVREYVTESGRIVSDAATLYAVALQWNLLPTEHQREGAATRLADLVRAEGFHISTGFLGTPLMTDALCETGQADLAYRLLLQRGCPSWLYPVTMGATTIWERWDSMLPDGSVNPGQMTSFNHYALGAVADWLHRTIAGLAPGTPGYRDIVVRPVPRAPLTYASAIHETPYGKASVAWRRAGGRFTLEVVVPPGAQAVVHLPDGTDPETVRHGHHQWSIKDPCPRDEDRPKTARDLLDSARLWPKAVAILVEQGFGRSPAEIATLVSRYFDRTPLELPKALADRRNVSLEQVENAGRALKDILM